MEELFGAVTPIMILAVVMGLTQMLKGAFGWDGGKVIFLSGLISYVIAVPYYALTNQPLNYMGIYLALFYGTLIWLSANGFYKTVRAAGGETIGADLEDIEEAWQDGYSTAKKDIDKEDT